MTWRELAAKISELPPGELDEQALVFNDGEGNTLRVLELTRSTADENADCGTRPYLLSE